MREPEFKQLSATLLTPKVVKDKDGKFKRDGSMNIETGLNPYRIENANKFNINIRYDNYRNAIISESLDNCVLIIWN